MIMQNMSEKRSKSSFTRPFLKMDKFGGNLNGFTVGGKRKVQTLIGGLITFFISGSALVYATLKFQQMVLHENSSINTHTEYNAMSGESFDIGKSDFRLAIGLESWINGTAYNDPKYLRWVAQYWYVDDGVFTRKQ